MQLRGGMMPNAAAPPRCCTFSLSVKVKVKVALLSITLHVKTYKGIEKNFSHSPTVKHIKCTGTTTDKTRHIDIHIHIVIHIQIPVQQHVYFKVTGSAKKGSKKTSCEMYVTLAVQ